MGAHGLGVGMRHYERGGHPALGADGTKDVGPFVSGIARSAGARSTLGPDAGEGSLLADPRFILEPHFQRFGPGVFRQSLGYRGGEVFLKASTACSSFFT